jgi:hypothetical protein
LYGRFCLDKPKQAYCADHVGIYKGVITPQADQLSL